MEALCVSSSVGYLLESLKLYPLPFQFTIDHDMAHLNEHKLWRQTIKTTCLYLSFPTVEERKYHVLHMAVINLNGIIYKHLAYSIYSVNDTAFSHYYYFKWGQTIAKFFYTQNENWFQWNMKKYFSVCIDIDIYRETELQHSWEDMSSFVISYCGGNSSTH